MLTVDEVRTGMRAAGSFSPSELDSLTQQSIDDAIAKARGTAYW